MSEIKNSITPIELHKFYYMNQLKTKNIENDTTLINEKFDSKLSTIISKKVEFSKVLNPFSLSSLSQSKINFSSLCYESQNTTNTYNNHHQSKYNNNSRFQNTSNHANKQEKGFIRHANNIDSIVKETPTFFSILRSEKKDFIEKTVNQDNSTNSENNLYKGLCNDKAEKINLDSLTNLFSLLGFGNYNQVLYIFSPLANSSIGPFSYNEIKNLHNKSLINSSTKVRLLDLYKIRGKAPFDYMPMK